MELLPSTLLTEINWVMCMKADALLARYGHFFATTPPHCASTLRSEIIYRLQERHYRTALSKTAVDALNTALERRNNKASRDSRVEGTEYVRVWRGERYSIIFRSPHKYEYNRQIFHSPSEVAKLITGSNWNGREFFHMPSLRKQNWKV